MTVLLSSKTGPGIFSQAMLHVHFFRYCKHRTEWNHPTSRQAATTMYLVIGGDGELTFHNQHLHMRAGHAYLLPKDNTVSLGCTTGVEKFWSWFSLSLFNGVDLLSELDEIVDLGEFDLGMTVDEFREHVKELSFTDYCLTKGLILQLLSRMRPWLDEAAQRYTERASQYEKLFLYIEQHLHAGLRVTELAELMGMTPQSLSRAFKRDMSTTIKRYLMTKLNARACNLLSDTDMKIKDIAHTLGYDDEYHFIRIFTRLNNASPTKYREFLKQIYWLEYRSE